VVVALAPGGDLRESLEREGIKVECVAPRGPAASVAAIARFASILRRERPEIVQAWTYKANLFACVARAIEPSAMLIWNIRTVPYRAELGLRQRVAVELGRVFSALPAAIVYNSLAGQSVHTARGFTTKKSVVIHNGIPVPSAPLCRQRGQQWRRRLGLADGDVVVSYVKRLANPRWHEFFFRAARRVAESHDHVRFVCVGRGIGRLSAIVQRVGGEGGLVRRCVLLEHTSDVTEVYGGSDIVVSASGREGFPNAIGEAMACGDPCIVTNVGDSAFLVGETGKVVAFGDVDELAEAMCHMVSIGDERRRQLGALAHARIAEHFSLERMIDDYIALYEWADATRTPGRRSAACAE
jgi:glycosyltransferase involved in cell wall biosynthesis